LTETTGLKQESLLRAIWLGRRWAALTALLPVLLLALAALPTVATLYGGYWFRSHEFDWYPLRVVEYAQGLRAGSIYPRWCPDFYGGFGCPLFNWYPIAVCGSAAALVVALGIGPIAALKLILCGFIPAAGIGAYGLAYGETRRRDAALISGFIYLFLPYRFTDLFVRGELTEFAAYSILPFALWGYRALGRARAERRPLIGAGTAVAHAVVWFCHPIIGVMLTGTVALMLLWQVVSARDRGEGWRQGLYSGCVALFGTLMASVYLGPAFLERSLVRIDNLRRYCQPTAKYLVNWRDVVVSGPYSAGAPTIVGAVVLAICMAFPLTRRKTKAALIWLLPVLYLPLLTNLGFSLWFWRVLPFGRYLLYPWRPLGFVGLFAATGVGIMWSSLIAVEWRRARWLGAIAVSLFVAASSNGYNKASYVSSPAPEQLRPNVIRDGRIVTTLAADTYLPRTVREPPKVPGWMLRRMSHFTVGLADAMVPVTEDSVSTQTTEIAPARYAIEARASRPGFFDMYVFDFPGWKVKTLSGPSAAVESTSPLGYVRVTLPAAGRYQLIAYFGSTPLRTVAGLTSLSALLLAYPFLWYLDRKWLGKAPSS
jgi:6-pyruvoyl-tetrahydropterin synthase related domain